MVNFGLGSEQIATLVVLAVVGATASTTHWILIHRATRAMPADERPFRAGLGLWHVGMLRRQWYPVEGRSLYRWIVATYVIQLLTIVAAAILLARWLLGW